MIEDEIIAVALDLVIDANKKEQTKKTDKLGSHALYEESVEMAEHISYHAVKGVFPEKLFSSRSPNETQKEADYIKANYKQHTLPVFVDYISTITRPFGDGNWSINYKEEDDKYKSTENTFQEYVEHEVPIYGSLENFIKFILPSIKTIDANGFIAVRPVNIPYKTDELGETYIDGDKLYEPTVFYFKSKDVIYYNEDFYLFLSKNKSKVSYGGRVQNSGNIYELYTENAVYFIRQKANKIDNEFEVVEFYRHDSESIPVHQLMGIPNLQDDAILWQSPFLYSVDLLDIVAMNANWLQASINKCVFPIPVMFGSPCDFRDVNGNQCQDGKIYVEGVSTVCPSCHGQGLTSRLSALGTFLLNPSNKFEAGETSSTQEPLKFVSPEVHTLEFISNKVAEDTSKARNILHLRDKTTSVNTTKNNTTATEIYDDSKAMYSFIKPISDQIFTLYEFCLKNIGIQRYGADFVAPELSYPKNFDFKTPEDYLKDISSALQNNLPPSFIQTILMQYINSFYGDNSKTTNIFRLVMSADRLFGISQDEINMQLAKGTIAKWEQVLHTSILSFINDSIQEDSEFLNKDVASQIETLRVAAMTKADEISGVLVNELTGTAIPTQSSNTLSESVGGLTGMIEIVKAVASGVYDLDAAVALVSQRFGISEEQARLQLGTPQIVNSEEKAATINALT